MGSDESPIANMLVASYLGLCQWTIAKIACEGVAEDASLMCGGFSQISGGTEEAEIG